MEQSRTMESILQECQMLANQGYKEITLIGQNIDAYGRDMVPKRNFAQLLEFLNNNLRPSTHNNNDGNGIERIRYVTSHPRYFTDRVIDAVANLDKVCECFHMPFQAGDNDVLKRMRRGYTYESYMKIIHKIRKSAPDAAICADIIVGFPGETDEAFQRTLDLMNEVKFDNVNSFAYSPRPNTEAALFEDQIPEDVKAIRLQQVQELATKHGLERSQRYLHRVEDVLVEDVNPRNPSTQVMGRTRQGRQVYFDGNINELKGRTVPVRITDARTWSLMGELVKL
jgi:tRNA-2-methylthio-N6-dimethylallyladenosine synthase